MRILGIDSSLTATGLARVDIGSYGDGAWNSSISVATVGAPKPTKDKSKLAMVRRVNALLDQIEAAFDADVDAVGIEGLAFGARGEGAWVLPWVWGRCLELCERHGVPLTVVATSARAKFITGKGNADKDTVTLGVAKQLPHADVTNNNEADAVAVAAAVAQQLEHPILPVTQYRIDVVKALGN